MQRSQTGGGRAKENEESRARKTKERQQLMKRDDRAEFWRRRGKGRKRIEKCGIEEKKRDRILGRRRKKPKEAKEDDEEKEEKMKQEKRKGSRKEDQNEFRQ